MGYEQKFYRMAAEELSGRRAANDHLLAQRTAAFAQRCPDYAKYRDILNQTGERLALLILSDSEHYREQFERIKQDNQYAQAQIERLLVSFGLDRHHLEPIYTCPLCKDTGVCERRRCQCVNDIVKRRAADELNEQMRFSLKSFDDFDVTRQPAAVRSVFERNLQVCKRFAEDFHLPCSGILMMGGTGLGKTHLSLAIARVVLEAGSSVVYGSAPDLLDRINAEHFGRENEHETADTLQRARQCDLLVLDDLGAEWRTPFSDSVLYNLINHRIHKGMPLVINTNLTNKEFFQRYGERIVSRLMTLEKLTFDGGEDIRQSRQKQPR
jgi:DNA replication protein DnaC